MFSIGKTILCGKLSWLETKKYPIVGIFLKGTTGNFDQGD